MIGMGFTLARAPAALGGPQLSRAAPLRGVRRARLGGLPSGVLARGPHGLGRAARARAVAVPGRGEHRVGDRSAGGRVHRAAPRAVERRVVLSVAALLAIAVLFRVGRWYLRQRADGGLVPDSRGADSPRLSAQGPPRAGGPDHADLLQVHLPGEHHQLLHVLPDPQVRRVGAERPAPSLRLPRRRRRRHHHRRAHRATASAGST